MAYTREERTAETPAWFTQWFDSVHYHRLYANRDEQETQSFTDALLEALKPAKGASVIDVGCGAGRHCKYLAAKGFDVTGIDTAFSSIQRAKRFQSATLQFIQHDMRSPFGENDFEYVFNFFTSFGYFKSRHEHQAVIQNMAAAVKPGGTIVIDYLNVAYAEEHLIAAEEKETEGIIYYIKRWVDDTHFYKKISIYDGFSQPVEYVEKVAKFTISDFRYMLYCHDLRIAAVYGDYQLNDYSTFASPRLIMVVKKA